MRLEVNQAITLRFTLAKAINHKEGILHNENNFAKVIE